MPVSRATVTVQIRLEPDIGTNSVGSIVIMPMSQSSRASCPPLGGELLIAMSHKVFTSVLTSDWHAQAETFFVQAREQPGVRLRSDRRREARRRSTVRRCLGHDRTRTRSSRGAA
jgi:hypothetical protein